MDHNSALEREYELELRNGSAVGDDEFEQADNGLQSEFESEDDIEGELEGLSDDREFAIDSTYGDRFYEISMREAEADWEVERRVGEVLDDIEREYFFGKLGKWAKRLGKSGLVRGLAKKAFKLAKSRIPALQAIEGVTQLARGNLRGALGSLAKTAISMHPAGAAAMQGLRALGFQGEADEPDNREAWHRFAELAEQAYEELARRTNMQIDNPLVAAETAHAALKAAMARTYGDRIASTPSISGEKRRVRKITLGSDEVIVIRAR